MAGLAYLAMLFILQLTHTAGSDHQLGGRGVGKHNNVAFVDTSQIFATQDAFFFGTELFDRFYHVSRDLSLISDMIMFLSSSVMTFVGLGK